MESEVGSFVKEVIGDKMRFLEMMDDDFNTAGAIAVLHEIAGSSTASWNTTGPRAPVETDVIQAAAAASQTLRRLGQVLGLFRTEVPGLRQGAGDGGSTDGPDHPASQRGEEDQAIRAWRTRCGTA